MTAIFHDMLHCNLTDFVDDVVVKSPQGRPHTGDLRKVFKRCQKFNLRISLLKCAFGVIVGKFLGFVVYQHDIDLDLAKAQFILDTPPTTSQK